MLDVITQLLALQELDHKLLETKNGLAALDPQRRQFQSQAATAETKLHDARHQLMALETRRKDLELQVVAKQQMIERYSLQQFQTKKNEEYRALSSEIETCRHTIAQLDDAQLELMVKADEIQQQVALAAQTEREIKQDLEQKLRSLEQREQELTRLLATLEQEREQAAAAVEASFRQQYERLQRHKGQRVVVGVHRGVCGGCHMTLPPQVMIQCRSAQELIHCPNCGRILYYSDDMDWNAPEDR